MWGVTSGTEQAEDEVIQEAPVEVTEEIEVKKSGNTAVVTLDANGGKFSDGSTTQTITIDDSDPDYLYEYWDDDEDDWVSRYCLKLFEVGPVEREGYTLVGWSKTKDGDYVDCDDGSYYVSYGNANLYAVWAVPAVLTLDANGGKFSDGDTTKTTTAGIWYTPQTREWGFWWNLDEFRSVEREGYTWGGWSDTRDGDTWTSYYECGHIEGNVTLYAVWTSASDQTPVAATGITISPSGDATLKAGKTLALTATVAPANASDKTVTWASSDTGAATVDSNGLVTAKGAGTATITASTNNGFKASVKVTVQEDKATTKKIKLSKSKVSLAKKGKKATVTVTATPDRTATGEKIKVKNSSKKIASTRIDQKTGKITITAKKKGTCTLTVTVGKVSKKIKVTVKK